MQAAFILGDPYEWGLDIQILTDVMLSGPGESQKIPLFACNADIVYNNEHPAPRYTQGAFLEAFRVLYESQANVPLEVQFCGKPFENAPQTVHVFRVPSISRDHRMASPFYSIRST